VAPATPGECFWAAIEAARIALKYRTPVIVLSDGYLANGAEPWRIPDVDSLPDISVPFATEPNHVDTDGNALFWPYVRDPETGARPWAIPGTPGLEHRIGGLEKADMTGEVSYDPANHELMTRQRAAKVSGIARELSPVEVDDPGPSPASVLLLGWGSTYGAIQAAVRRLRARGFRVAHAHLRHLNPFPPNLGEVLESYPKVLVPEMNLGQLLKLVRAQFLVDAKGLNIVRGKPFKAEEIEAAVIELMGATAAPASSAPVSSAPASSAPASVRTAAEEVPDL
jgi:2-oxoglutarate ferredoxin oxidoreductase subunit alpha